MLNNGARWYNLSPPRWSIIAPPLTLQNDRAMHDPCIGPQSTRRSLRPAADRDLYAFSTLILLPLRSRALLSILLRCNSNSFRRYVASDNVGSIPVGGKIVR